MKPVFDCWWTETSADDCLLEDSSKPPRPLYSKCPSQHCHSSKAPDSVPSQTPFRPSPRLAVQSQSQPFIRSFAKPPSPAIIMPNHPASSHSSARSTPEPDFPSSPSSSFTHHGLSDFDDYKASEQLRRNITEIARQAAVDARNARNGSLDEEYMRKLVEEVEAELGVRRS